MRIVFYLNDWDKYSCLSVQLVANSTMSLQLRCFEVSKERVEERSVLCLFVGLLVLVCWLDAGECLGYVWYDVIKCLLESGRLGFLVVFINLGFYIAFNTVQVIS